MGSDQIDRTPGEMSVELSELALDQRDEFLLLELTFKIDEKILRCENYCTCCSRSRNSERVENLNRLLVQHDDYAIPTDTLLSSALLLSIFLILFRIGVVFGVRLRRIRSRFSISIFLGPLFVGGLLLRLLGFRLFFFLGFLLLDSSIF